MTTKPTINPTITIQQSDDRLMIIGCINLHTARSTAPTGCIIDEPPRRRNNYLQSISTLPGVVPLRVLSLRYFSWENTVTFVSHYHHNDCLLPLLARLHTSLPHPPTAMSSRKKVLLKVRLIRAA